MRTLLKLFLMTEQEKRHQERVKIFFMMFALLCQAKEFIEFYMQSLKIDNLHFKDNNLRENLLRIKKGIELIERSLPSSFDLQSHKELSVGLQAIFDILIKLDDENFHCILEIAKGFFDKEYSYKNILIAENEKEIDVFIEFSNKIKQQKNLEPEINDMVNKNFFNLI